ncbi:MAG: DUF2492 family protein [Verrucomicrobia bacterium]|nr:MAG: DUF2492 family protein [Verrucomicrobiota bacterium]
MQTSIHGHEVIEMMVASGRVWTVDTLLAAIRERFGPDARFHTCSAENLTAEQLIAFLQERGKFMPAGEGEDGFVFNTGRACNH